MEFYLYCYIVQKAMKIAELELPSFSVIWQSDLNVERCQKMSDFTWSINQIACFTHIHQFTDIAIMKILYYYNIINNLLILYTDIRCMQSLFSSN